MTHTAQEQFPSVGLDPVPTTNVLAIGKLAAPITAEQRHTISREEVHSTVVLYLEGKIAQWWYRQDAKGVVFLLNAKSTEEAETMLSTLPFVRERLMSFDFMPLGPLVPLRVILRAASGTLGS